VLADTAGGARAQAADTSARRLEVGGASDVTNERFAVDTFDDTTFTGRHVVGSPEYRNAAVVALEAAGRWGRGPRYLLWEDATAGDRVLRSDTRLELRAEPRDRWRLALVPELDVRRDRSFGGDLREGRLRSDGRARWTSGAGADAWEGLAGGDWLRSSGTSEVTTLDRNAGRAWLRWLHAPLDALWESELGYGADVRCFPDSVNRDHIEQHGSLALRRLLPGGGTAGVEAQLDRRRTIYTTAATRDHFWSGRVDANATVHVHETLAAELWLAVDGYRYDRPDTSAYFAYDTWTAYPALRWSLARDWNLRAGPRFEWLRAPTVPAERYHEVSGVIEADRLQGGNWWSIAPAAGWRQYEHSASTTSLATPDLHSSYLFVGGDWFADVGLPGRVRVRASGSGRFEQHEDPSQDASSVYLSLDVRRTF